MKEDTKQHDAIIKTDDFDLFEILSLEPMNSETEENVPDDCSPDVKTKAGTQLKISQ